MLKKFAALMVLSWAGTSTAQMISTVAGGWPVGSSFPQNATNVPVDASGTTAIDPLGNVYIPDPQHFVVWRRDPLGNLTIVAGTGFRGSGSDNVPAISSSLGAPAAVALDAAGDLIIADSAFSTIRKVDPTGMITTLVGASGAGFGGDGGPAYSANVNGPRGVAVDASGNIYISDTRNGRIRRIGTDGTISTFAGGTVWVGITVAEPALSVPVGYIYGLAYDSNSGNTYVASQSFGIILKLATDGTLQVAAGNGGGCQFSGDNGPATAAGLCTPAAIAVDSGGNLYIADTNNQNVRKVDTAGTITTIAGTVGVAGYSGDNGPAMAATLLYPVSLAADPAGNLYIGQNSAVRRVDTSGVITTVAGNGSYDYSGDGGPATSAGVSAPQGLAADNRGDLFIADADFSVVRKVDATGIISTIAGTGVADFGGDGGPATSAYLSGPYGIAVNGSGSRVWIADSRNDRVRLVDPDGTINTVAGGDSYCDFGGDGGPAISASLCRPVGVAYDFNHDSLLIADKNNLRIRSVDYNATISTVAGNGSVSPSSNVPTSFTPIRSPEGLVVDSSGNVFVADPGHFTVTEVSPAGNLVTVAGNATWPGSYGGDGTAATASSLYPEGVAKDAAGNIYIADTGLQRILKVDGGGLVSTIAGNGTAGYGGDGAAAGGALVSGPNGLAIDSSGQLYLSDSGNDRLRRIDSSGVIQSVAGDGTTSFGGDGSSAVSAALSNPSGVAADATGNVYIADLGNNRVRKVDGSGTISTVAGTGAAGFNGDNGPGILASLNAPQSVAADGSGNVFIADLGNNRVRKVDPSGTITTVAGRWPGGGITVPGLGSALGGPTHMARDAQGNLYIASQFFNDVLKLDPTGNLSVVAGNGVAGNSGDGGPATSASLNAPYGVTVDSAGNLFIADLQNQRVRKVDATGVISTVAGTGVAGFGGDGGLATAANLNYPADLALDSAGNLYIDDGFNGRIRKVDPSGIITTVAGNGQHYFSGDGGPATAASFDYAFGIALDSLGRLYIAETRSFRVRMVDGTGTITTVVGTGVGGYGGDGGPAVAATLFGPEALTFDAGGNMYLADGLYVRKVDNTGIISTIAGNGSFGFNGDGGPAIGTGLSAESGIAVDGSGNVYFADYVNERIRVVLANGTISTLAGSGFSTFGGDGGPAALSTLNSPSGVSVDKNGNLYIADQYNDRIRKVDSNGVITTLAGNGVNGFGGDMGPATAASLAPPQSVAADGAGNVYIADLHNGRVRKVDVAGTITTIAGNGLFSDYQGDGGLATSTPLGPYGVAVDAGGIVYIADTNGSHVLKVDANGIISTLAGPRGFSPPGFAGDGGSPTDAALSSPAGIAVDSSGNVLIADTGNSRIRRVTILGNNTPTGAAVTVTPVDKATSKLIASIQFSNVATSGETTVTSGVSVPAPPANFAASCTQPVTLEVSTSASLSGSATVCLNLSSLGVSCPLNSKLLHYSAGAWQELPLPPNPPGGQLCGVTTSFSPFAVFTPTIPQTIKFGAAPAIQYLGAGVVSATGGASGNPVVFSSTTPAVCNVTGSAVTGVAGGTCTIAADQAGNATYSAAPEVTQSFSILPVAQTITFNTLPSLRVGTTVQATATASSGLAVTFSSLTSGVCSVIGSSVTGLAAGTCTVAATQSGNANYSSAPQVTQNITVAAVTGLSPSSLTFGPQPRGTTSTLQSVTLTNAGTTSITRGAIATTVNFTHPSTTCGSTIAAKASCTINLAFAPAASIATSGILTGTLTVGTIGSVSLSGTVAVPTAAISPPSYAFASQQSGTTSVAEVFTYSNTGSVAITVASPGVSLSGGNAGNFAITNNGCASQTLGPGGTCQVSVAFAPTAVGNRTTSLQISDSAGGASQSSASLSGMGVSPAATLTGPTAAPVQFPAQQVGTSGSALSFTYTNTGIGPITVSTVSIAGTSASSFSITSNGCAAVTLASGASCPIAVEFTPASPGIRTATLRVADTAGGAVTTSLAIQGNGSAPSLSLGGTTTLNFGAVTVPTARTLSLSNTGTAPFLIGTIALATAKQFAVTGGTCAVGGTVNNGGSCTVVVTFTPSGTAVFNDNLTLSGSGLGTGAAAYSVSRPLTAR
jgi:sugar lactone lactonase YvrE